MEDDGLPEELRSFLRDHIGSVGELELLLFLARERSRGWSLPELSAELRVGPEWAGATTRELLDRGLLRTESDRYRFEPVRDELIGSVDLLAKTYSERRLAVISFIVAKPNDRIRVFADAFRIRKDRGNG